MVQVKKLAINFRRNIIVNSLSQNNILPLNFCTKVVIKLFDMEMKNLDHPTQYKEVNKILSALSKGIVHILDANLIGIYLFGSLTYNDFNLKRSDLDLLILWK